MLNVYGSKMCPDCIELEKAFAAEGVAYEYHDITGNLKELKAFLALRDSNEKFAKAKEKGLIVIPIVQTEDGSLTFKWQEFLKTPPQKAECSDGVCGVPQK